MLWAPALPYRHIALLAALLASLLLTGCGKSVIGTSPVTRGPVSGDSIVATARTQIGVKYKSGGTRPDTGFDCSGFVCWTYAQYGVNLPRKTDDQASAGASVKRRDLRPGDVVVFRISRWAGLHTGIYTGKNKFIHSPSAGKRIREESLNVDYWSKRFVSGRRVI